MTRRSPAQVDTVASPSRPGGVAWPVLGGGGGMAALAVAGAPWWALLLVLLAAGGLGILHAVFPQDSADRLSWWRDRRRYRRR